MPADTSVRFIRGISIFAECILGAYLGLHTQIVRAVVPNLLLSLSSSL